MTVNATTLLRYLNLQMAAEALYEFNPFSSPLVPGETGVREPRRLRDACQRALEISREAA